MSKLPFVSICLLTYNRAKELPTSIESLLKQTHSDFELIINDDRSPDETESVCREYERRDPRVRYCKNETNLRYAGNQNAAIERARSDYVAIVHDGDVYRSDVIEKWTRALLESPSAGFVFNAYEAFLPDGSETVHKQELPPVSPGSSLLDEMLRGLNSPIFGIVMVRKSAVFEVGPFDTRFSTLADVDMWMRLLSRFDVAYIPEPLITIHPREPGHHNNPGNLKVRRELEHIYFMNAGRRTAAMKGPASDLQEHLTGQFRRRNRRSLLWCLRRRKWPAVADWLYFLREAGRRQNEFWNEGLKKQSPSSK